MQSVAIGQKALGDHAIRKHHFVTPRHSIRSRLGRASPTIPGNVRDISWQCVRQEQPMQEPNAWQQRQQESSSWAAGFKNAQEEQVQTLVGKIKQLLPQDPRGITVGVALFFTTTENNLPEPYRYNDPRALEKLNLNQFGRSSPGTSGFSLCSSQLDDALRHEIKAGNFVGLRAGVVPADNSIVQSVNEAGGYKDVPAFKSALERIIPAENLDMSWTYCSYNSVSKGWLWVPMLKLRWPAQQ